MEAILGKQVLEEVEEMTLEEMLDGLRAAAASPSAAARPPRLLRRTHLTELDVLAARHVAATQTGGIAVAGRSLPLVYRLVSALAAPPLGYALLLVVDAGARFDATRLSCTAADLRHVYVQRVSGPPAAAAAVAAAADFMLYHPAARASAARRWWGTIVVAAAARLPPAPAAAAAPPPALVTGSRGWLRVDRAPVIAPPPLSAATSLADALAQRPARQDAVAAAGWAATSAWGGFVFHDPGFADST